MNLFALFNPAPERDLDVALFRLAQRNAILEVTAPIAAAIVFALGFGDMLDHRGYYLWLLLLIAPVTTGLWTHHVLHRAKPGSEPDAAGLRAWRRANTIYLLAAGVGWGGLGLAFAPDHANQNMAVMLTYLAAITTSTNSSGVHSHRLFFIAVGITLAVMLPTLPIAFGRDAFAIGLMMVVYPFFLEKVALGMLRTLTRTIELQKENEQLLRDKAIAMQVAERERIYRDLHDDVGAKLLGLAISAQRANQSREADLARSALQDLRDVVSRPAHQNASLDELLADWRTEISQRVHAAGLALGWELPDEELGLPVSPEAALHLSRILREAISNILHHAQARHINVVARTQDDAFCLCIADDGIGFAGKQVKRHRGMNNMQSRADILGADIEWRALEPCGCQVVLAVPVGAITP